MKRTLFFVATIVFISAITMHLQAEYNKEQKRPPKMYCVSLAWDQWMSLINGMEISKNTLKLSKLPSDQVTIINDSLLTIMQNVFYTQIKTQADSERASQQKKDTTKPKK